jgi:hypothetical protein
MKEFSIKQEDSEQILYCAQGTPTALDDDNVCAKAVRDKLTKSFTNGNTKNFSYYIKTDPNKNVYDPTVKYSIEPKVKKSFINKTCKNILKFTQVSENIFSKYLEFLRTGSKKYLQEVQRDIK